MQFKINATLNKANMDKEGEWKITLIAPASEVAEMVKICAMCREEPLKVTIENEQTVTIGATPDHA